MNVRNRRTLLLGAVGLLACAMVWQCSEALTSPPSTEAGTQAASLEFGGRTRSYLVHVPPGYDAKTPLPLVFVLHGGTQSAGSAERMSGMSAKADQDHFIAVYPSGTGRLSGVPTWNAGNCCGYALENHIDDIGFFRALIEMSDQVAAIAPVEGALNVECHPPVPVSVLIFHGTADHLVPFNGGSTPFHLGGKRTDASVAQGVDFWVKRDACSATPKHEETEEVHIDTYSGCQDRTGVTLYAIQGGHHVWPGHALSGNSVPATDLIWSFFAAHPKP